MPESSLQEVIDGLRSRIQAELEAQFGALVDRHAIAIEEARAETERAADERWAAQLASSRAEWDARLSAEVEIARADSERRLAEALRVQVEADRAAAEATAATHEQMTRQLVEERQRAAHLIEAERASAHAKLTAEHERVEAQLEGERERARAQLDAERERARAELAAERQRAEARVAEARRAGEAERQRSEAVLDRAPELDAGRLLEAVAAVDGAGSLSDILALTAAAAAVEAPRAALFVVNGPHLEEWQVPELPALSSGSVRTDAPEAELLREAVRAATPVGATGSEAAGFAGLSSDRAALAVPLTLGGQVVSVLYADEGHDGDVEGAWRDAVQILGRHASARLGCLTAMRTAEAIGLMGHVPAPPGPAGPQAAADDQGARRYARLLVSEIKLYNEAAVRAGREKRDLIRRLKPEIDRARRLYDERIPAGIPGRDACFEQELVQTLADGDAALLG